MFYPYNVPSFQLVNLETQLNQATRTFQEEIENLKKALDTEQLDHNKTKRASQDHFNALGVILKALEDHDLTLTNIQEALDTEQLNIKKTKEASQAHVKALEKQVDNLKKALDTEQFHHNKTNEASQARVKALEHDIYTIMGVKAAAEEEIENLKKTLDAEQFHHKDHIKALEQQVYQFCFTSSHSRWQHFNHQLKFS
jgi:DNA-binding transcriptional MerR regulator